MVKRKSFSQKKIGTGNHTPHRYDNYVDMVSWIKSDAFWMRTLIFLASIVFVFYLGKYVLSASEWIFGWLTQKTITLLSDTIGQKMKTDQYGHINVMLVWFGGDDHHGGYLADSIIVASFAPDSRSVSMISIPRDLYVNYQWEYQSKINSLFARRYYRTDDLGQAAEGLMEKASEVTWVDVSYYALIDFSWFETLIDSLWWVEVDVPYTLIDRAYPDENLWYTTFAVDPGKQILDGEMALKYARSRHSTSDFSRALRQQQIIQWVVERLLSARYITNLGKIEELYQSYEEIVTTNISLKEILGLVKYAYNMPTINSFVLTMECSNRHISYMSPWCLLYPWEREQFNGVSVLLPQWSTAYNVSDYEYTQLFGYIVAEHQWMFAEDAQIAIYNWIADNVAKQYRYRNGLASNSAIKLIRYGFDVIDVDNAPTPVEHNIVYVHGTGQSYDTTLQMMKLFTDFVVLPAPVWFGSSGVDLSLVLGNEYIETRGNTPFNFYK